VLFPETLIRSTFAEVRLGKVIFWRRVRAFVLVLAALFSCLWNTAVQMMSS